jgi:hypothetical protein
MLSTKIIKIVKWLKSLKMLENLIPGTSRVHPRAKKPKSEKCVTLFLVINRGTAFLFTCIFNTLSTLSQMVTRNLTGTDTMFGIPGITRIRMGQMQLLPQSLKVKVNNISYLQVVQS